MQRYLRIYQEATVRARLFRTRFIMEYPMLIVRLQYYASFSFGTRFGIGPWNPLFIVKVAILMRQRKPKSCIAAGSESLVLYQDQNPWYCSRIRVPGIAAGSESLVLQQDQSPWYCSRIRIPGIAAGSESLVLEQDQKPSAGIGAGSESLVLEKDQNPWYWRRIRIPGIAAGSESLVLEQDQNPSLLEG